ncbi:MAG: hypothetical protein AB9903_26160 [Vulcanimicrobiota bacterium]
MNRDKVNRIITRLVMIAIFLLLCGIQVFFIKVEIRALTYVSMPAFTIREKVFSRSPALASEQGGREKSTAELAEEYRALRNKKGHYNGGVWDDDLDHWGGRMHSVMVQLGQNLGTPGRGESDITGLMGEPDSIRTVKGDTHLIYLWRGWHDYLYFVCCNGKVKESRWYFAFE